MVSGKKGKEGRGVEGEGAQGGKREEGHEGQGARRWGGTVGGAEEAISRCVPATLLLNLTSCSFLFLLNALLNTGAVKEGNTKWSPAPKHAFTFPNALLLHLSFATSPRCMTERRS